MKEKLAENIRQYLKSFLGPLEKSTVSRNVSDAFPSELHIELTYKCNLKCRMCDISKLKQKQSGKDITFDKLGKFLKGDWLSGISLIVLSGGEPWLNEDFPEIFELLADKFPESEFLVLSNLYDTELVLQNLKAVRNAADQRRILIGTSVDGLGSVHDFIRGRKGSFNAMLTTAAAVKRNFPQIDICYNFTLIPENAGEIFKVFDWSRKNRHSLSIQAAVRKKDTEILQWTEKDYAKAESEIDRIFEYVWAKKYGDNFDAGLLASNERILLYFLNLVYLTKFLRNNRRFFPNCPCGEKYLLINPEGNAYFCPVNKNRIIGNIKDNSFYDLWKSKRAAEVRDALNQKRCSCWLSCTNNEMLCDAYGSWKDKHKS